MYYLSTSCLILFFLFSLIHHLPCASSKEEFGSCENLFQCGNTTAGFPFWGENRDKHCGHPLLELHCFDNSTSLTISDYLYRVLHLDHTSITLSLARTDFLEALCSSTFINAALPPEIFDLSPTYKSITFYHCNDVHPDLSSYRCPGTGPILVSANPEYHHESCHASFTLNVPTSFDTKEKKVNVTNLKSILEKGFEVKVKIDMESCQECSRDYGICGFNKSMPLDVKCIPLRPLPDTELSYGEHAVTGAASAFMGVIFIVAGLFCVISSQKKTSNNLRKQNLKALIPLKHYSYSQVKRITESFAEVIGKGGFGTVYRGTLTNGRSVAVKILKDSKGNGEDFINEVASMSKTSHVNIVSLLGFCSEGSKRAIIYEYLENGSLDQFISSKRSSNIDWGELYGIALGVARGLEYLHHGCRTRIVHFDIKPQNVLLDDNLCPKVSDFGLAKLCGKKESILSLLDTRGTIGYIAPEVCSKMYGRVSHKSDVYSYGMLLLEMIGARNKERFDQNSASNTSSIYFPEWIYKDLEKEDSGRLIENGISSEDEEVTKKMTIVGLWCIQPFPSDRPEMNRVVEMMEGNLDTLEVPPRPVLQNPPVPLQESSTFSEGISIYPEV